MTNTDNGRRQQCLTQFEQAMETGISTAPGSDWPFRGKVVVFAVLAAFTLGLRLYHLDYESLFIDELAQAYCYPNSTGQLIHLAALQHQPPVDYWLGNFIWSFSHSDFSLRLPAALFGLGSVLTIVAILLPVTNRVIAFATGLLAALMPFNLYFSQYARPYSIAIFFTLLTLFLLDRAIKQRNQLFLNICLLFFGALFYLYSRAYPPLLIVLSLIAILVLRLLYLNRNGQQGAESRRIFFAILGLAAAALAYLPMMGLIIDTNQGYATRAALPLIDSLIKGWPRFALRPIWEAYLTQTEPLGYILLPLLVLSPCLLMLASWRANFMLFCLTLLLPFVVLLDAYIFPAMSDFPYRTTYPIYLLPLCLILAAAVFYFLWESAAKYRQWALILRGIMVFFGISCLILTARATLDFESTKKNEDWKGLSQYLGQTAGEQQLLIFDAITPLAAWTPDFYGFPRYYQGSSNHLLLAEIPLETKGMLASHVEPVVILFAFRNINLTSASPYPIMPVPQGVENKLDPISEEPELATQAFTSFLTIRLKSPTGNTAVDTLKIIQLIQGRLKANSSTIHLQLAAGALAKILGNQQLAEEYLKRSVEFAPAAQRLGVARNAEAIRSSP